MCLVSQTIISYVAAKKYILKTLPSLLPLIQGILAIIWIGRQLLEADNQIIKIGLWTSAGWTIPSPPPIFVSNPHSQAQNSGESSVGVYAVMQTPVLCNIITRLLQGHLRLNLVRKFVNILQGLPLTLAQSPQASRYFLGEWLIGQSSPSGRLEKKKKWFSAYSSACCPIIWDT